MSFESHHQRIEQHAPRGDQLQPSKAHDEAHKALASAENRPKKSAGQESGSLEMTDPFKKSDGKGQSGFPGADTKLQSNRDSAISQSLMPTTSRPISDASFQTVTKASTDTEIPSHRDESIKHDLMGTKGYPVSDAEFQPITH